MENKTSIYGRKAPVISSDEEAESDGPWLSKETGAKTNGISKSTKSK
jgi:hypothetical protein